MRSVIEISCLLVVVGLVLQLACNSAQSASLDSAKEIAKKLAEKAADAADKTEPADEAGGVRQTIAHTAANLILEKGLDAVGKRYPVVAAAAPMVQKFSKPAMKKIHEKINDWRNRSSANGEANEEAEKLAVEEPEEKEKKVEEPKSEVEAKGGEKKEPCDEKKEPCDEAKENADVELEKKDSNEGKEEKTKEEKAPKKTDEKVVKTEGKKNKKNA